MTLQEEIIQTKCKIANLRSSSMLPEQAAMQHDHLTTYLRALEHEQSKL